MNFTSQSLQPPQNQGYHPARDLLDETLTLDHVCQTEALLSGLRGTFVAFISTSKLSLNRLLNYQRRDLPVINSKVEHHGQ